MTSVRIVCFVGVLALSCGGQTGSSSMTDGGVKSSGGNDGSAGEGGTTESPPEAVVSATLGMGATGTCNINEPPDTPFLTVGSQAEPAVGGAGGLTVLCSVQASGASMYSVNAQISDGSTGGISVSGDLLSTGTGGLLTVSVTSGVNSYNETDCTFAPSPNASPAIAPGRIWGTVTCPMLEDSPDDMTCAGTVDLLLENCSL